MATNERSDRSAKGTSRRLDNERASAHENTERASAPVNPKRASALGNSGIDPLETSDIGLAPEEVIPPVPPERGIVPSGGMSNDFEPLASEPPDPTVGAGGDGSIGSGGGFDDASTNGGGTRTVPSDEEVLEARRRESR